jgi:hypothetical protein
VAETGTRLIFVAHLADKVSILFFFLERDNVLPDVGIGTFVGLAGTLEFGDGGFLVLLLSEVLLKGQGVVLLFGLPVPTGAALGFVSLCRGGCGISGRDSPGVGAGSGITAPFVGGIFGSGIDSGVFFVLELSVAVCASPGLLDLLVRVAVERK